MEEKTNSITASKKEIARDLFQETLISIKDSMIQMLGGRHPDNHEPMTPDMLVMAQERGLSLVINNQLLLITFIRPLIREDDIKVWKAKSEDKQSFEKEDNDYAELRAIEKVLNEARAQVSRAKRTKTLKDDYVWHSAGVNEQKPYLYTTGNFDIAVDLVRETYEEIFGLMINHDIISVKSMQVSKNQLGSMF